MISRSCVKVKVKGQGRHVEKHDFFYSILCIDVIKRSKVKRVKVKGHKRSRSKVNVTINVKEKAGGLRPTTSCFLFHSFLDPATWNPGKGIVTAASFPI